VVELATAPGDVTQPASLSDPEFNLDPQGGSASATVQVQESAGTVQFAGGNDAVSDLSGVAVISVVRLYGASGSVTVNYQTVAVNATPGVNYVATSGTLTLGPGQTSGTIQVPILNDPYENHDNYVNVVLNGPTGGAVLGGVSTTVLRIMDSDPDVTPPQVSGLTWAGSAQAISNLTLDFSAPLDPTYASDPSNYQIVNLASGSAVPIASVSYNAASDSVTVVPASPLPSGQYDQIEVVGNGATAVRDLAGNLLDGSGSGLAGSNYVASFAQGTRLQYVDNLGNRVTLQLKGAGYLEQVRDASGEGILLDIVGMVPHRTTLSGTIKAPGKHKKGQTELGTITGLGQFGDVSVRLKTPPFRVNQFPFVRRGSGIL
jgi:Calx-beta domain